MKKRADWDEKKRARVRYSVHYSFAIVFLLCVFFFRYIDNGSLIDILFKVASFTYGPLLGLFAFGIFTRRMLPQHMPLILCITALSLSFGIDFLNNPAGYFKALNPSPEASQRMLDCSAGLFHGYKIGNELLIINAALTFILLFLFSSRPGSRAQKA
jgi:hypothetical protein